MNVLLVIAHFYRPEDDPQHTATDAAARETKAQAIRQVIQAWRGHFGVAAGLNIQRRLYEPIEGPEHGLEIMVLVHGEDHLLDKPFCEKHKVRLVDVPVEDPRLLPFAVRNVLPDVRNAYDMFVYSEDDLRPPDGSLVWKVAGFVETFGWRRLVLPNRYEWNPASLALKTFVDGDLKPAITAPFFEALPDEPFLRMKLPGRDVGFRRALNPHSGFFALTAEQLSHWIAQPHYDDRDCSFIGPLESAATLGVLKTFPIYKPFARDAGWLEIQHLDKRFSTPAARKAEKPAAEPPPEPKA